MVQCFSQGHTARTVDMKPYPLLFFDIFFWPCCARSQLRPLRVYLRKYAGSHLLCPPNFSSFPPPVVSEFSDRATLVPESILLAGRSRASPAPAVTVSLLFPDTHSEPSTWGGGAGGPGCALTPHTLCNGDHVLLPEGLDLCHIQSPLLSLYPP